MYRPSMYNKHDETLAQFAELFNSSNTCPNIIIKPIDKETFIDDGNIIDLNANKSLGFDWEYRDKYFKNGIFRFDTLGQYERKIIKPSINLSIQCDSTVSAVAIAWHEDFKQENPVLLNLSTDSIDQFGKVRYTHHFKIYQFSNIAELKLMIQKAFDLNQYNHTTF